MARAKKYPVAKYGPPVLEHLANGKSLSWVCQQKGMPCLETVYRWMREDEEFERDYRTAKREAVTALMEKARDIADDTSGDMYTDENGRKKPNGAAIQRAKLQVDTYKWFAAKLEPKTYGDKLDMTTNGKDMPTPILGGLAKNPSAEEFVEHVRTDDDD